MDDSTYQQWWPLHLRVASGDKLCGEEQVRYQNGLRELDREESEEFRSDVTRLRELREKVAELESRLQHLRARQSALQKQISGLETLLRAE